MPERQPAKRATFVRPAVTLLTAMTFLVLATSGVVAFVLPFSISVVGLHALTGFVFIAFVGLHATNNRRPLIRYLRRPVAWAVLGVTAAISILFWQQPSAVRAVLGLSGNLGPALERFEFGTDTLVFDYVPSPAYKMRLTVKPGPASRAAAPPHLAIWLENQGGYHIKTLLAPEAAARSPYWAFKHAGWEKAKQKAEELASVDAVTAPTPNGSFDPRDYILPRGSKDSTPYSLLLEVDQPGDDEPSLVYAVSIDNSLPSTFQLLELKGYPKREPDDENGKETWGLYFVDDTIGSAIDLIDGALLTIERAR
jgi:hypothetical protein